MPTPRIAPEISAKFKNAIEKRLREGYAPRGLSGGKGSSVRAAAKDLGIAAPRMESWVYRQQKDKALGAEHFEPDWSLWNRAAIGREVKVLSAARRWLLTASQNDTAVHAGFWQNLTAYAEHIGAEILVGPFTYQLGTFTDHTTRNNVFAEQVRPFLRFERQECGNVLFCAEMNTLPTANRPLSGLQTYTRGQWGVFPHAKVALETVPAMPGKDPPIIMTTGCCTVENYIAKKAGLKAAFHHVIGATLVEIDHHGRHFCRQINAVEDGSFQDLDIIVKSGTVSSGHRVAAINWGDIHRSILDPAVALGAWGIDAETLAPLSDDSMLDALRPFDQFFHDLFHGEAINHWQEEKHLERYPLHVAGKLDVTSEVSGCSQFLRATERSSCRSHVVESNHDCLSMDTEALTGRGWLRYDDISPDDEVLSLDTSGGIAIWSKINAKFDRENSDGLLHAKGEPVDMMVTPGHRVLSKKYRPQNGWGDLWEYVRADNLPAKFAIPVSALSGLPEWNISDDWLTITGWLLTDGCISRTGAGRPRIFFSQSKPCPTLEAALSSLDIQHSIRSRVYGADHEICGRKVVRVPRPNRLYCLNADASARVLEVIPKKKELPAWAFSLSDRQFDVLLCSIVDGDGSWDGGDPASRSCAVVHGEVELLNSLQACAVAHGWRAHLSLARGKDWRLNLAKTGVWTANKATSVKISSEEHPRVWCLSVPHTNFMVRRNGKAFFTGNCWINRWLQRADPRKDLGNAEAFYRWNLAAMEAGRVGDTTFSSFRHALKEADPKGLEGINFIPVGSSFEICKDRGGIECGLHGHVGTNGSVGSTQNLTRVAIKINKGHDHQATVHDGVYSAGVCATDPNLQKGPSSHSKSHIVTYLNSKRSIITMQGDRWRA